MRNIHCGPFGRRNTPMSCCLRSVSGNVVVYLFMDIEINFDFRLSTLTALQK